jgi:sensor domain CHASE-containing protein
MITVTAIAVFVVGAIVLQLCLPLIGKWNRKRQAADLARKRARLVEEAADQQLQVSCQPPSNREKTSND